jgi:D-glycero-D-manno-heptose 1,7-bisphosphate phosphatase
VRLSQAEIRHAEESGGAAGIDCNRSIMIGDCSTDAEAGHAVGCRTIYVDLGYREAQRIRPDLIVSSLQEATDIILNRPDTHSVEQSHEPS